MRAGLESRLYTIEEVAERFRVSRRTFQDFLRAQPYARKSDGGGQIKTGFNGACRRAAIIDFSPHDCRHTWATWHYAANRDLVSLMHLGGWQSEKMALRYAHMNVEHLSKSIVALPWENPGKQATADPKTKSVAIA
jgi:integrase